jgi:alpha-galactosidase
MSTLLARYELGRLVARYLQAQNSRRCLLQLLPLSLEPQIVEPRLYLENRPEINHLPKQFIPAPADHPHSLVELKLREDPSSPGFGSGITMLDSSSTAGLAYEKQILQESPNSLCITTHLLDQKGRFRILHHLQHRKNEPGVTVWTEFVNHGQAPLTLEMLSSFCLNDITPFDSGNCTPHLHLHRFRSWWSLEGRPDSVSLENLHLERSWTTVGAYSERFGQLGSKPVSKWFPTAAVEDRTRGIVWAAQLAWAGSWQMELFRRGDRVSLTGGLADREFGHWSKKILPGEAFQTPPAYLTAVHGDREDACHALLAGQQTAMGQLPAAEEGLPVIFNEWCTTWGDPTHDKVLSIARRLQGLGVRYLVIDDGWAVRPPEATMQSNGDWIINTNRFPGGLRPTCSALRELGFIPGIWFEFEVVNPASRAWLEEAHLLQRDGITLQVGPRRFWNMNDPWVEDYLTQKVIHLLRDNDFGFLKIDYNDSIGLGCDHPDSLGEGLRLQVEGIYRFLGKLRQALPELVIENCSSGGHRLEPSMQALTSMGSFSDAHEAVIVPIIARNLQRLILPRQSLIWVVLHQADTAERIHYSLTAAFLGRVCLSGEIYDLSNAQLNLVREGLAFYQRAAQIIDLGRSHFYGSSEPSYVDPVGWQAVLRSHEKELLLVAHGFDLATPISPSIPLPSGQWEISQSFCTANNHLEFNNQSTEMKLHLAPGFQGAAWLLRRKD